MGVTSLLMKLTLTIIFLSVHAMIIPPPPEDAANAPDRTNSLSTAFPSLFRNGTTLNRRKRCNRPLILIFYSRSSTLQPFRSALRNGRLRSAPSKAEKLTIDEKAAMQRCLQKYGEVTQVCALLANMTAPLKDATNSSALTKLVESMQE